MQRHAGAARWRRLTLAALLALLAPPDIDAIADDIGIAVLDTDDGPGHPGAGSITPAVDHAPPWPSARTAPATGDERAAVSAIAISPTDRAPPRD